MIITFNGDEGSGKSTVAQKIATSLDIPRFYMGQIFRDIAKKKGLTLVEYLKSGETDPNVDKEVDEYMYQLSQKNKNCVIEGRTAFYIIPHSLKIYLEVDLTEGAKRVYSQLQEENSRNEIRDDVTFEKVIAKIRERRDTDNKRYKMYYGIDIRDKNNYDFILDTTRLNREEVFKKIEEFVSANYKND